MWEQKEELYNAVSPDYLIREKRSKAIKEIAEKLETTEETASRKMASLKSYQCQLKQSYKAAKTKSGSGTSDVKKPVWPFYDTLYFLDDDVNPRDTICNISTEVPSSECIPKKRSKKESQESSLVWQEEAWFSNKNILMAKFLQSCNESQEGKSEDDLFGQNVAKSLSKISNWEIKEETKLEIQKLLFQAKKTTIFIKNYFYIYMHERPKLIHSLSYLWIALLMQHLRVFLDKRCSENLGKSLEKYL